MSVIRPQTQVHDGFATIRSRSQYRSTIRPERCRTLSLKTDYSTNEPTALQHLPNFEPLYSNQNSYQSTAFRREIKTIDSNGSPKLKSLSPNYQHLYNSQNSHYSLPPLPSRIPQVNQKVFTKFENDEIVLYSSPAGSPRLNSIRHRSCDELELEDTSNFRSFGINDSLSQEKYLNHESPQRIPLMRSATLQHRKIGFSLNNTSSNDEINIRNYEYYNPNTNYYRPCTALITTNPNRSSSAEILDKEVEEISLSSITQSPQTFNQQQQNYYQQQQQQQKQRKDAMTSSKLKDHNARRYHTLGHSRSSGNNHRAMKMMMMMTNNHCNNPEDDNDLSNYVDSLDYKIGCQTTLRSKPLIPWYELAISKDLKRKSCPPINNQAHVVAAFEQSLANMTTRLQQLTATAERKDGELTDMRQTIELLRKQSIQAGLTTAHMQSMGGQQQQQLLHQQTNKSPSKNSSSTTIATTTNNSIQNPSSPARPNAFQQQQQQQSNLSGMQRQHSSDSMGSLNSISSGYSMQDKKKKKGWLRSSFTKAFSRNAKISKTNHHSNNNSNNLDSNNSIIINDINNVTNSADYPGLNNIVKNSNLPPQSPTKKSPQKLLTIVDNAKPVDSIELVDGHACNNVVVDDLKKQLREKDLVLTDIRLEALSSASQLENLKDTVMKMRAEMLTLKQNNDRLQKLVTSRSLAGSDLSLGNSGSPTGSIGDSRRYSAIDSSNRPQMDLPVSLEEEVEDDNNIPPCPAPENQQQQQQQPSSPLSTRTHIDLTPPPPAIEAPNSSHIPITGEEIQDQTDGKKISIAVYLGQPESFTKYLKEIYEYDILNATNDNDKITKETNDDDVVKDNNLIIEECKFNNPTFNEHIIAYTYISGKTSWQNLDYIVRKTFKDYVARIDPGTNLGLNTDSITSYHLGEAKRGPEIGFPELLPCGYIIGNVKTLYVCLQGVGSLAFDSLIPRSIVHRYISLLTEHRRLILCGPSGTGKSFLARKLAEFLVARSIRANLSEAIATFNVDHKSSKELRQFLSHIAEQASMPNGASELPSVIILDNLHHASALGDVFSCLLSAGPAAKLPCIIGTMSQATCNTTNLQLHHNFRWVLTANHMEPVKGFLGRFLRRRVFTLELQTQVLQPELTAVLAWLSTVWQHINRFLENHSSSDVTIGPRLFLSCPLDLKDSQVWFTDVWNYHLAPYIIEGVREGVQLYGRRGGAWNDPSTFIRDTYPWPYGPDSVAPLRQISAEDVGLEGENPGSSDNQDPLLNMLMHLQEAANYSGTQENESDCISLDSNITAESSAGVE